MHIWNVYCIFYFLSAYNKDQWLQIDFLATQNLSGILTQGSPDADRWITTYSISTSIDGYTFYPVRYYDGTVVTFNGNSDRNTIVRNYFPHVSEFSTNLSVFLDLLITSAYEFIVKYCNFQYCCYFCRTYWFLLCVCLLAFMNSSKVLHIWGTDFYLNISFLSIYWEIYGGFRCRWLYKLCVVT